MSAANGACELDLAAAPHGVGCPPSPAWLAWLEGQTPAAHEPWYATHLARCPDCQSRCRSLAGEARALREHLSRPHRPRFAVATWLAIPALAASLAAALWIAPDDTAPPPPTIPLAAREAPTPTPTHSEAPPTAVSNAVRLAGLALAERRSPRSADPSPSTDAPPSRDNRLAALRAGLRGAWERELRAADLADETRWRASAELLQDADPVRAWATIEPWLGGVGTRRGERAARLVVARLDAAEWISARRTELTLRAARRLIDAAAEAPAPRHAPWLDLLARGPLAAPALAALARTGHPEAVRWIARHTEPTVLPAGPEGADRSALLDAVASAGLTPGALAALARVESPAGRRQAMPLVIDSLAGPTAPLARATLVAWTGLDAGRERRRWANWWRSHPDHALGGTPQ